MAQATFRGRGAALLSWARNRREGDGITAAAKYKELMDEQRKQKDDALKEAVASGEAGDTMGMIKAMQRAGIAPAMKAASNKGAFGTGLMDGPVVTDEAGKSSTLGNMVMDTRGGMATVNPAEEVDAATSFTKLQARFAAEHPELLKPEKVTDVAGSEEVPEGTEGAVQGEDEKWYKPTRETQLVTVPPFGSRRLKQAPKEATPKAPPVEGDIREVKEGDEIVTEEYAGGSWAKKSAGSRWNPTEREVKKEDRAEKETARLEKLRQEGLKEFYATHKDIAGMPTDAAKDPAYRKKWLNDYMSDVTGGRGKVAAEPKPVKEEDLGKTVDVKGWSADDKKAASEAARKARDAGASAAEIYKAAMEAVVAHRKKVQSDIVTRKVDLDMMSRGYR